MKRSTARWLIIGLGVLIPVLALAVLEVSCAAKAQAVVIIHSTPDRATVFGEHGTLGFTDNAHPLRLTLAPGEQRVLRFVRKDYQDAEKVIRADDYIPTETVQRLRWNMRHEPVEVRVTLFPAADVVAATPETAGTARLVVTTDPPEAEVFLDGRRVGVTPLTLSNLPVGVHALRLVHPECVATSENISLNDGKETTINRMLESRWVGFYRKKIQDEPGVLTNYGELAHHYALKGLFVLMNDAFREGLMAMKRPDASGHTRFWQEFTQTYRRTYIFPPETRENPVRPGMRELIKFAIDNNVTSRSQIDKIIQQMDTYDAQVPLPKK